MQKGRYATADSPDELERERLAMLEEVGDPLTRRRLEEVGVSAGWSCLEVGGRRLASWAP